ncbi:MAG: O-antigen ligase family protein [Patescibacteria group bacterium]|nr:O-antigen ligase family protein [Patescibacteria group bacterium]MDE1946111.1 O-antigen ligase family protein [Patescibacteria group bacterium]
MNPKAIAKYLIFAGLWSVLLLPFLVGDGNFLPNMFFPFITGKNFLFRIIIEIVLALFVYLAFIEPKYRPRWSWLAKAAGIFALVMLVADMLAVNPEKALWSNFERMDGWVTLIHMFAYFVILGSMLKAEKAWLWFFRTSVAAAFIMFIIEYREWIASGHASSAVMTTLGNTIYVAVYMLFNFFFALILLYKDVIVRSAGTFRSVLSAWLTWVYLACAALFAWGIWMTATRGVILGLLGGLFVAALCIIFFEKQNALIKKVSVTAVVAVLVLVGGFFALKNTKFVQNDPVLHSFAVVSWSSIAGQGQARQLIWPLAIKGFLEKPLLGWGQEGFNYVFNKYYDPRLFAQEQWFDRAHNELLDILVGGGALGEIAYLAIYAAAICLVWKRRQVLGVTDAALLIGVLAAYFAQSIFVFDNLMSYVFFFTVLAYIHSRDAETTAVEAGEKPKKLGTLSDEEKANYIVLPIALVVLCVTVYFANIKPIEANTTLIAAMQSYPQGPSTNLNYFKQALSYDTFGNAEIREQLVTIAAQVNGIQGLDAATKQQFDIFAYQEMLDQLKATPKDARYQLFMGTFLDNIGQYSMAIPYLETAISLSPAKQTMMFELEKAYLYTGQNAQALAIAKQAYDEDHDFSDAKDNYLAAAIVAGDDALAKELWGGATTTSSGVILQAYLIRASAALAKGDKTGAIAEVEKDILLDPGFASQGQSIIKQIESGTAK